MYVTVASKSELSWRAADRRGIRRRKKRSHTLRFVIGGVSAAAITTGVISGCASARDRAPTVPSHRGIVERVIDGDTVELRIAGSVESVRLIGLDTPESVARNVPDQCFGAEASEALRQLLPPGTEVDLRRDVEGRDHYGRLLLYLHRASDDLFINHWLLENGYADSVSYEPNTSYEIDFDRTARSARSAGRGLWGACDGPDQPLDPS